MRVPLSFCACLCLSLYLSLLRLCSRYVTNCHMFSRLDCALVNVDAMDDGGDHQLKTSNTKIKKVRLEKDGRSWILRASLPQYPHLVVKRLTFFPIRIRASRSEQCQGANGINIFRLLLFFFKMTQTGSTTLVWFSSADGWYVENQRADRENGDESCR